MLMNISEIKERVGRVLRDGFDHKFLNEDNKAFAERSSRPRRTLPASFSWMPRRSFSDASAKLVACHLTRVRGTQRDVLWDRRSGVELLVRIFRGPPDDVAASHVRRKSKTVWRRRVALWPWAQLSRAADLSR